MTRIARRQIIYKIANRFNSSGQRQFLLRRTGSLAQPGKLQDRQRLVHDSLRCRHLVIGMVSMRPSKLSMAARNSPESPGENSPLHYAQSWPYPSGGLMAARSSRSRLTLRLARQFRPQGQYRASPRTACRGTAAGDCRVARTDRLAPTMSLLRRAHDHRRDLRAMAATTRATSRDRTNREQPVVTRHGLRSPHAATPPLQRMPPGVPFARISATGLNVSRGRFPIHGPPGEKSHSPSHHQRQRRTAFAITSIEQKLEIPIDHHRSPASSCMGGFRTPDGIRKPSPCQSLNHTSPPVESGHKRARRSRLERVETGHHTPALRDSRNEPD
jgi:hypothetical protein